MDTERLWNLNSPFSFSFSLPPSSNYITFVCLQPKGHVPQAQLSPTSDEYILDLLGTCEQKLLKLMDDLGGKDINDVMKEMEDAEVMLKFSCYLDIILL